jgi:hypothetical protein
VKKQLTPIGIDFLELVKTLENECEKYTRERFPSMGAKATKCLEQLGTVLSLTDRAASCFWKCRKGDHIIEYLAGRISTLSRAALRLLLLGFYDESLSLTRSIGEIANLLILFRLDSASFTKWKGLTTKHRLKNFSPFEVRIKLDALSFPTPIDKRRYGKLSEIAAHVTPDTKPQAHNPIRRPTVGAHFQEAGVLIALNELGLATSLATVPLPALLELEEKIHLEFKKEALKLLRLVGKVDILSFEEILSGITPTSDSDRA